MNLLESPAVAVSKTAKCFDVDFESSFRVMYLTGDSVYCMLSCFFLQSLSNSHAFLQATSEGQLKSLIAPDLRRFSMACSLAGSIID